MGDRKQVAEELGGRPADAADQHNPEDDHRDLALFSVHFLFEKRTLPRGGQNCGGSFIHVRTLHTTGVRNGTKVRMGYELWYPGMLKFCEFGAGEEVGVLGKRGARVRFPPTWLRQKLRRAH